MRHGISWIGLVFLSASAYAGIQDLQGPPMLTSITPSDAQAGGPGFFLLVSGDNFTVNSVVQWNGSNRTTSFMGRNQLSAAIPREDIASGGVAAITVINLFSNNAASNPMSFRIDNPAPLVYGLSPAAAGAGGPGFVLTVRGANFVPGSSIQWNGIVRATSFVDSTRLTTAVSPGDIADPGQANVAVMSPGPGGGGSGTLQFTTENPVPVITYVMPSSAVAGGAGLSLSVYGTGFTSLTTLLWNGQSLGASFVSPTLLTVLIGSKQIDTAGSVAISVANPSPGGGNSNRIQFTITPQYAQLSALASVVPASVKAGQTALLLVRVIHASDPPSTGISVTANLTPIGGASSQLFYDDGTHGDEKAGDGVFSYRVIIPATMTAGAKDLSVGVRDAQGRKAAAAIHVTIAFPKPQPE